MFDSLFSKLSFHYGLSKLGIGLSPANPNWAASIVLFELLNAYQTPVDGLNTAMSSRPSPSYHQLCASP